MSERPKGLTVAVSGAAGYIAGRLLQVLLAHERIERVLAFDVRPLFVHHDKLVFDHLDVRNPAYEARLEGVDILVHLAFIMDPIHDEALMHDVNVSGSQNVFGCAARAGVKKIIYTSSGIVYGAHPDNEFPLTEQSPLRANVDLSYAAHKLEVEYAIKDLREEFPDLSVTVFRPAIVFGGNVDNAWSHFLESPFFFGVKGHLPHWQFVHEEDLARALFFAIENDLDGVYNLAPEGWMTTEKALSILGRRRLELSEPMAFAVMDRLWRIGLAEAPAGMLHYLMYPWVVSPEKLARSGFSCTRSSAEAFSEVADRVRGHVRVGRARVRRSDLALGAAAGLGALGAAAALSRARRSSA